MQKIRSPAESRRGCVRNDGEQKWCGVVEKLGILQRRRGGVRRPGAEAQVPAAAPRRAAPTGRSAPAIGRGARALPARATWPPLRRRRSAPLSAPAGIKTPGLPSPRHSDFRTPASACVRQSRPDRRAVRQLRRIANILFGLLIPNVTSVEHFTNY